LRKILCGDKVSGALYIVSEYNAESKIESLHRDTVHIAFVFIEALTEIFDILAIFEPDKYEEAIKDYFARKTKGFLNGMTDGNYEGTFCLFDQPKLVRVTADADAFFSV
jgi:hypothetical protein